MEKRTLPNATAVLVLGILSIIGCCFYGSGIVLGIIALVLAAKDMKIYREEPELYSNYSTLNTGRILAIVGIVLSALSIIAFVAMLITYGGSEEMQRALEEMQRNQ